MTPPTFPVLFGVLRSQRRGLLWWILGLIGVAGSYVSIFPAMGAEDLQQLVDSMPEAMTEALGYDQIATVGLVLLVAGFATVAFAVGAATGRRSRAVGFASATAVGSFMLDAIGSTIGASWMTGVSPFSSYSQNSPLIHGRDLTGLVLMSTVPAVAALLGLAGFQRRDLMV